MRAFCYCLKTRGTTCKKEKIICFNSFSFFEEIVCSVFSKKELSINTPSIFGSVCKKTKTDSRFINRAKEWATILGLVIRKNIKNSTFPFYINY